jgi:hypothetical protein
MRLIMIQYSWPFAFVVLAYICMAVDVMLRRARLNPEVSGGKSARAVLPSRFILPETALVVPACLYTESPNIEELFTVTQGRAGQHMLLMIKAPLPGKVNIDIINAEGRTIAEQKRPAVPGRAQYFSCDGSQFAKGEYLARVRFRPQIPVGAGGTIEHIEHIEHFDLR